MSTCHPVLEVVAWKHNVQSPHMQNERMHYILQLQIIGPRHLTRHLPNLFHFDQSYLKDQCGIARNLRRGSRSAVGPLRWNDELPLATNLHTNYSNIPALNHVTLAKSVQ